MNPAGAETVVAGGVVVVVVTVLVVDVEVSVAVTCTLVRFKPNVIDFYRERTVEVEVSVDVTVSVGVVVSMTVDCSDLVSILLYFRP